LPANENLRYTNLEVHSNLAALIDKYLQVGGEVAKTLRHLNAAVGLEKFAPSS
jgi:hypothetical protein